MLLDDMADYLSSGGLGTVGSTAPWGIYKGILPDAPDKAVALYETGGFPSVHAMASGPGQALVERPRIQVVVRADAYGYSTGRQKIQAAVRLLDGLRVRSINGVTYHWAAAVQSPFAIGPDANSRPMVAVNVDVTKALSTA